MNRNITKLSILMIMGLVLITPIVSGETELINNGGFETGDLTGWTDTGCTFSLVTSDEYFSGSYSLMMGGYTCRMIGQTLSPIPDYPMYSQLVFFSKIPSYPDMTVEISEGGGFGVSIYYSDSTNEYWSVPVHSADWERHVLAFDPDKTPVEVRFSTSNIETVYVDDVWLAGHNPTLETCDDTGSNKVVFQYMEKVYLKGEDWRVNKGSGAQMYEVFIVPFGSPIDDAPIPDPLVDYMGGHAKIYVESNGEIGPTIILPGMDPLNPADMNYYLLPGKYLAVVDANGNGLYDEGIDLTSSFLIIPRDAFVVPEVPLGTIASLGAMLTGLLASRKKNH